MERRVMAQEIEGNVETHSRPSELKITDMRTVTVVGAPMRCTLIKIDTNQGQSSPNPIRQSDFETK